MAHHRYPELDGLRGLAVLFVFLLHYWGGAKSSNLLIHFSGVLVHAGWSGVSLFFVLSGFLISGIIWDGREEDGWWWNFYMRRALRIFPLYYFSLLLIVITAVIAGNAHLVFGQIWYLVFYLQNLHGVTTADLGSPLWPSHLWSLSVEEQFYLIWPFMLTSVASRKLGRSLCLTIFVFSFACRLVTEAGFVDKPLVNLITQVFTRWGELSVGAYLALAFRSRDVWHLIATKLAGPVAICALSVFLGIGFYSGFDYASSELMFTIGLAAVALFYGALLVLSLTNPLVGTFFKNRVLQRLGTVSYGLYVYSVLLTPVFEWITRRLIGSKDGNLKAVTEFAVAATITYVSASLSSRFLEVPFLKLRSNYQRRAYPAPARS